ncbi:MAG: type IV toxin-antitoxin system AbiEi family antitoxin domain-containing protein [Chloroflexi bacterium]|nr:type IV toxin-antitoxin system AbiEi family antitoxin domain-containing protein [Chloroflexota bacterium]
MLVRHDVFNSLEEIQALGDTIRRHPNRAELVDLASEQHGYFTTAQAARCGYAPDMLTYHVKQGNFRRVHRGVYRFRDFPFSPRENVVAAWLAVGKDEAVVSHESALDLWDLSDVVPEAVHVTIPRARRSLARRPPPGVIVHTTTRPWDDGEVRSNEGIRVTSPERTILDAADAGTQPEQIEMAIGQALRRGWLDALRLRARAREREHRVSSLVEQAVARHQIEAPA